MNKSKEEDNKLKADVAHPLTTEKGHSLERREEKAMSSQKKTKVRQEC